MGAIFSEKCADLTVRTEQMSALRWSEQDAPKQLHQTTGCHKETAVSIFRRTEGATLCACAKGTRPWLSEQTIERHVTFEHNI
jgi:hypothetical protein